MLAEIKIQKSTHNGRLGIVIRKARESDVHLIDEMHDRISKDSMYFRYLGVKKPGLEELHRLCSNENGMVLVATTDTDNQEKIIGIACYTLYRSDSTSAEPAVLVEDSYQGLGLGKMIVADLIRRAIQNGVTQQQYAK